MLVQDTLTGALHDVPGAELGYYGGVPGLGYYGDATDSLGQFHDGFGNPVGFLPFLGPIASALAPIAAKVLPRITNAIPGISQLVGGLLPGGTPPVPGLPPGVPMPQMPGLQVGVNVPPPYGAPQMPFPFPRPVPPGWMHPPPGYQGMSPHRRYMRCVTWPGPPGLVPVNVGPEPAAAAPAMGPYHHRRVFRRRR